MLWNEDILGRVLIGLGTSAAAVAGAAAIHVLYDIFSGKIREKNRLGWAFLLFMVTVNTSIASLLVAKVDSLHKEQRIRADFLPPRAAFSKMQEAISDAGEGSTIYAVNSFEVPFLGLYANAEEAARAEEARKQYFELIEKKLDKINYYRIIQIRDTETANLAALVGPTYIQHFKAMLDFQERSEGDKATSLRVAHTHYSMSFVIIEKATSGRSYLFWQVDNRLPTKGGFKAAGYMYVIDPDEVIIRRFMSLLRQVEQEKGVRPVHREELEPASPPALPSR